MIIPGAALVLPIYLEMNAVHTSSASS
jgi:hypothetical protein